MAEQTPEKQSSRKILLTIFIIVLIALNGVLLYLNIKNKDEINLKDQTIKTTRSDLDLTTAKLDSISNELDIRIAEVQKLGGDVESLVKAKEELEKDKVKLKTASVAERRKYTTKIKDYETLLINKDEEIVRLKSLNDELYTENTTLKTTKVRLSDSLNALDQERKVLTEKVNIAAALKAESLQINGITERGKEKDGGEYRAKQLEKIKVSFNLAENPLAKIEGKNIYMRLIEPDGAAVFDMATGGGTFTFEGQETFYTAKQEILFDNNRQNVSFVYAKGTPYKNGKHIVELYADGFKIGQGSFVVK